jgi:hypothetical protein
MTRTTGRDKLIRAAEALEVAGLGDQTLRPEDPLRMLQLAAAIVGAAEAHAMVHASTVAADGNGTDPMNIVDMVAFQAAGMRGPNSQVTGALWAIWTLRRLQSHLAGMLDERADADLAAAAALGDGIHALLSGFVHRVNEDTDSYNKCVAQACDDVDGALSILKTP